MQHTQQALPVSQFRRKNGQQSSCENCRKSKLACDHAVPHCGRCVRLKRTETCVYLISPLAKSSSPSNAKSAAVSKRPTKEQNRPSPTAISAAYSLLSPSPLAEVDTARDHARGMGLGRPSSSRPDGLSKMTNWGSIFSDFNIEVEPELSAASLMPGMALPWKEPEILQHATTALAQIPSRTMCEGLLDHALKFPDFGCHEPFLRLLHEGWWEIFEGYFDETSAALNRSERLIERLWINTSNRKIDSFLSGSVEWLQSWTGHNTTWDSLAYLLSAYGSACASLLPSHPLLADCHKGQVCRDLGKGIKACLFICEAQGIFSLNAVNAHASMTLLQNSYDGDDSNHNYANVTNLARLANNLCLSLRSANWCFIQTQLEQKAFHRAFTMDKSIATSSGRPPQLTWRFNQCPLPLDLSDEQLTFTGNDLDLAISVLDSDGWNTGERSYPTSYLRALSMLGRHREEILELTMGPSAEILNNMQSDIVRRLQATYKGLPSRLRYDPSHHAHLAPFDFLNIIFLHLEYHKSIFLLYRLSQVVPLSQNKPLLSSAKAIINVMTMIYTHRDRLGEMFLFFPWAVMSYGTPAAAILAIELLLRPQCLALIANVTEIHPRSEIIQELSVFISCLNSIPTTEGNHAPCRRVAHTLRKIMDQVLESPARTISTARTVSTTSPATDADSAIGLDIDWQVFSTGPCDADYTQLLDPSSWMQMADPLDFRMEDLGLEIPSDAYFSELTDLGDEDITFDNGII
ncbi:unnamed protein product [Penicillium egyptiacum]|uniref:Zn(2)-C6 fungal-type domain-containing protein n=1 Tax=Penicillium egyptiacum TaxID=1303716 RepID=A0A9W4K7F7_9EURO|nr:unnamed protein product [Penicillium egyptiacum]